MRQPGRDMRIKQGLEVLAIATAKTINIANTAIDVSGDTDEGFVVLLDRPASRQMTMNISGVTDSEVFRDSAVTGTGLMSEYTVEYLSADGSGAVVYAITGLFFMDQFSETGNHDGRLEFTGNFQSSGEFTKVLVA